MTRLHIVLSLAVALLAAVAFVGSSPGAPGMLIDLVLMLVLVGTGALLVLVVLP
jgi:hypothetical protein